MNVAVTLGYLKKPQARLVKIWAIFRKRKYLNTKENGDNFSLILVYLILVIDIESVPVKGGKFLKILWYCVGEKRFKADVSSVSPSSSPPLLRQLWTSLRWPIYVINSVDNTNLPDYRVNFVCMFMSTGFRLDYWQFSNLKNRMGSTPNNFSRLVNVTSNL